MLSRWRKIAATTPLSLWLLVSGCLPTPTPTTDAASASPTAVEGGKAGDRLSKAAVVAELYEVGEVRAFEYRQAGKLIGRSFGRYEGPVEVDGRTLHRFSTRLERSVDGRAMQALSLAGPGDAEQAGVFLGQGELWVDGEGRLVRAYERSEAAELRLRVVDGTLEAEAVTGVPRDERWSHPVDPDAAFLGYMTGFLEEFMLATHELQRGEQSWPLISLSTGEVQRWEGRVQQTSAGLELRTEMGERIRFEGGRVTFVEVPDIQLEVRPIEDAVWPTWEIEAPEQIRYAPPADARFTIRALELPGRNDDRRLAGEVLVPAGEGPFPAVVFLGGSAPTDRHGFAGPPAVDLGYHEITDALASAGFVVLRYDDHGMGESAFAPASWRTEKEDARRAFRTLLVQPEVNPDAVLVVGHGEGGWRALALADEYARSIVGVALLGTPGRSYRRIIGSKQPKVLEAIEQGQTLPSVLEANREWFREILEERPAGLIAGGAAPIWIAHGKADFEFDANEDAKTLDRLAREAKRKHELRLFDGLDHLFKPSTGVADQSSYREERAVDRSFIEALIAFCVARVPSK